MSIYFRIFQHLLPRSHAWRMIVDRFLRKFFIGLGPFQEDYRTHIDQIFEDIDPALTRELGAWEEQFQLPGLGAEIERRQALDAAWKAQGGQSPGYLQGILRDAGFDVYVHEWWYFDGPTRHTRDPRLYLGDQLFLPGAVFGEPECVFGEPEFVFGSKNSSQGYVLVNKGLGVSYFKPTPAACFGEPECVFGEIDFVFGETSGLRFVPKEYPIPDAPALWPYFVYIGDQIFPQDADVSAERKIEFERMILKHFPDQLWVGMLINYT
jgi:hypothetical protein